MKYLILFLLILSSSKAQVFIDTVYSFTPGSGQNAGQSTMYYPQNIFGGPSLNASKFIPESSPVEVLSIGLGGVIIVGIKDNYIIDGEGADFTIFENAFINQFNDKVYAEPAIISVSKDGINFIEFPYDFQTLEGLAGTNPTIGNRNPFNSSESGGNSFDLSDIGIDSVKYIKIEDITKRILDDTNHNNYDPTLSGFDLDAVAIINSTLNVSSVRVAKIENNKIEYYDLFGNKLENINLHTGYYIKTKNNEITKHFKNN